MAKIKPGDQKSYPKEVDAELLKPQAILQSLSQISANCGVKMLNSTICRVLNESGTITRQSVMTVPRLLTRHKTGVR